MAERQHPTSDEEREQRAPANLDSADVATEPRRPSAWSAFRFAFKAVEIRLRFIAVLVGIGLVIGYWDTIRNYWDKWTRPAPGAATALAATDEFYCPMHPSVVRDTLDPSGAVPKCPICGMPLSKRAKGELTALPEGVVSRVQLSPYRVQLAGITTTEARVRPLVLDVRAVGYVTIDERKLSRLVVRASGYVEKLYVNESFAEVQEGQPLAEIYSPGLYSAVQELLIAQGGNRTQLVDIAREKLHLLGVAEEEIDEILRTRKASPRLVIRAPHGGHVFDKRVVEGGSVDAGQMLFEVADLSTVWIEGEVFEKDAAMLHVGQTVEATVEALPGRTFQGHVNLVHPHMEMATRTCRVRFEVDNAGHLLRPGMFATVWLQTPLQEMEPFQSQLAAHRAAATALANTEHDPAADGRLATQSVEAVLDDELIQAQQVCPVTGAKLGSMGKPVRASAKGDTVFLCCEGCQAKLLADPEHYLTRLRTATDEGVLAVPEGAVIDTGSQQIVYVEREPGVFEGVAVTLGPAAGGYCSVISGLLSGDRVAAAGAFLVDAETRLNPAAAAAYFGASGTPASSPGQPQPDGAHRHQSPGSPSQRARDNLGRLSPENRALAELQENCPVTHAPLGSMGVPIKMVVQGRAVFLCCEGCKAEVERDPASALESIEREK